MSTFLTYKNVIVVALLMTA